MCGQPMETPRRTFHDLRPMAVGRIGAPGALVRVTIAVLNQASGTAGGIVAQHQRHDLAEERKKV